MPNKAMMPYSYSEQLVQRLNELYHDLSAEIYQLSHPEIFEQEKFRWERIFNSFLDSKKPITIVDLGTGTGFVPITIAKLLKGTDTFICSDISKGILGITEQKIKKLPFKCLFKFVKIDNQVPFKLPFDTKSINVVTINSVLHHVKDTNRFLCEIDRILKPAGKIFIGHEPNQLFYENRFLRYNFYLLNRFDILFKRLIKRISRFLRPNQNHIDFNPPDQNMLNKKNITNRINDLLIAEKLIRNPLSYKSIIKIVNIKADIGFKPEPILPNYDLIHMETYNHLSWVKIKNFNNPLIKWYDNFLRRMYPNKGANFFIVLKKTTSNNNKK